MKETLANDVFPQDLEATWKKDHPVYPWTVMSHDTPMTMVDNPQLVLKSQHPTIVTSTWLQDSWNLRSMLKLGCYQVSTLFSYCISLVLVHLCIPVSHSCIHCLTVFHLALPISPTNALFLKWYIRLCSCMLFNMFKSWLWLLFSLSTQPLVTQHHSVNPKLWLLNFQNYSSFTLTSMLFSIKSMLSSRLISELPDADYTNTQTHDSRKAQHMKLKPMSETPSPSANQLAYHTMTSTILLSRIWTFERILSNIQPETPIEQQDHFTLLDTSRNSNQEPTSN